MGTIVTDPQDASAGAFTVPVGRFVNEHWKEVSVSVVNGAGDQISGTGTLSAAAKPIGSDQFDSFTSFLDLANGERSWIPFLSRVQEFQFTPDSVAAGTYLIVTISTWRN